MLTAIELAEAGIERVPNVGPAFILKTGVVSFADVLLLQNHCWYLWFSNEGRIQSNMAGRRKWLPEMSN